MSVVVNDVTKIYGEQRALDQVSFEVKAGEIVGLLGPNGAGKSTLMKIITCYIPPTSGEASVNGFDIFEDSIEIRKCIGYLPEHNPLYPEMYVKEYLEFIAGLHKLKNKKQLVTKAIRTTGLPAEQNKKIGALSKGYRQRVGLAQVLLHDPEVLVLDEPTSGLDPNQIIEIRELIKKAGQEKTIILSTHIMQEVEAICNRAIIIDKGRIVADESTQALSKGVVENEVITVEFNKEPDEKALEKIKGVIKVKKSDQHQYIIETAAGEDIREDIFNFAVNQRLTVLSLNREKRSMEQVFQILTKK